MKICFISGFFPPVKCGVANYTFSLGEHLADLGHEIEVITRKTWKIMMTDFEETGLRVLPVVEKWDFNFLSRALDLISKSRPNVVHIQYTAEVFDNDLAICLLPLLLKLRLRHPPVIAVTFHEISHPRQRSDFSAVKRLFFPLSMLIRASIAKRRRIFAYEILGASSPEDFNKNFLDVEVGLRNLVNHSDLVIATDDKRMRLLQEAYPQMGARLDLIPLAVGLDLRADMREKTRNQTRRKLDVGKSPVISFFGYIAPGKGLEVLIQALAHLIASGLEVFLVIVGGQNEVVNYEDYISYVKRLPRQLGIESKVIWAGYCQEEQAVEYLSRSDVCVLPYEEGTSYSRQTFLTALALGLPVITTKGDETPRGLVDGENVLLVPPKNASALAGAISKVLESEELRSRLTKGGLELSRQFSWPSLVKKTEQIYQNALAITSKRTTV